MLLRKHYRFLTQTIKDTLTQVFSCEYCKIFRFFRNTSRQLPLVFVTTGKLRANLCEKFSKQTVSKKSSWISSRVSCQRVVFPFFSFSEGLVTYRFSFALRLNNANNQTLPAPATCVISRFSTKINSFLENVLNLINRKIADYIYQELSNLYLIVFLVSFFSRFCGLY